MSQLIEVKVPDIGDFSDVPVIELFVKVGDTLKVDDAIATLESDKATMDVPSSAAGVVKEVLVNLGDRVSEGAVLIKLEAAGAAAAAAPAASASPGPKSWGLRARDLSAIAFCATTCSAPGSTANGLGAASSGLGSTTPVAASSRSCSSFHTAGL